MPAPDIRSIDTGMLRTFDALMRERSVSRAATRLFLGQPAVSASLARLRQVFDDRLFTRTPHGVVPTPRALALAPRIEALLAELQSLLQPAGDFDPAASRRIFHVVGSDHAGRVVLPALCRTLSSIGSHIRLSWGIADYALLADRLHKGDADLGFVARITPIEGVESALLYEDGYVAVARRGHPALAERLDLERFCAVPQVVLGQSRPVLDDAIDALLARDGRRRHVQVAVTTFSQIVDLLTGSDMLAVFPERVARWYADVLDAGALPFVLPTYRLHLCWGRRSHDDAAVAWLRARILALVAAGS